MHLIDLLTVVSVSALLSFRHCHKDVDKTVMELY